MSKLQAELRQSKPFASLGSEVFLNLLRTAAVLGRKEFEFLKAYELTPSQYNVLRILRGAEPEGLICREIGERMVAYDPDVTKLLDRLEARGLLKRQRQQDDRRVIVTRISEEGLNLLKKIDGPMEERAAAILSHMSQAQLEALNDLLLTARAKSG